MCPVLLMILMLSLSSVTDARVASEKQPFTIGLKLCKHAPPKVKTKQPKKRQLSILNCHFCINFNYLLQKSCVLSYGGTRGSSGLYAVALTLEDFPAGTTNFDSVKPFSAVGLQFLVMISNNSGSCDDIPVFTASTPKDGECSEVQIGSAYRATIEAQLADFSKQYVSIHLLKSAFPVFH